LLVRPSRNVFDAALAALLDVTLFGALCCERALPAAVFDWELVALERNTLEARFAAFELVTFCFGIGKYPSFVDLYDNLRYFKVDSLKYRPSCLASESMLWRIPLTLEGKRFTFYLKKEKCKLLGDISCLASASNLHENRRAFLCERSLPVLITRYRLKHSVSMSAMR
jgi:hypothetical protein